MTQGTIFSILFCIIFILIIYVNRHHEWTQHREFCQCKKCWKWREQLQAKIDKLARLQTIKDQNEY